MELARDGVAQDYKMSFSHFHAGSTQKETRGQRADSSGTMAKPKAHQRLVATSLLAWIAANVAAAMFGLAAVIRLL